MTVFRFRITHLKSRIVPCLLIVLGLLTPGCGNVQSDTQSGGNPVAETTRLPVLATTGMIADIADIVGGDRAEVTALMGPGVDPHLYQPTARDQGKLRAARLIFYNGLHLEGKMVETFESLAKTKTVVAVSRDIPEGQFLSWKESAGMHDPHIWFDVLLWQQAVRTVEKAYREIDPDHAKGYTERAAAYLAELDQLDKYCHDRAAELEPSRRILITSHDAFHYFGRAYGFKVVGIQGISTDTEAGLKAITDAVDLIKENNVRAIFPETSVPRAAIERVARDSGAHLGPELYSDALGDASTTARTYAGMIRTNMDHIVDALKGSR